MGMGTDKGRRNFLDWSIRGGVLAFLGSVFFPVLKFIMPPEIAEAKISQVKLPFTADELAADENKFRLFKFGRSLGIIVHTPSNELKAFSAMCTHLSCTVQYRTDQSVVWCACHNGKFDLEGRNISGPPPRPLEKYEVHLEDSGEIFVSRSQA